MTAPVTVPDVPRRWRARRPPPTTVTVTEHRGLWATVPTAVGPMMVALTYAWFADVVPSRMPVAWDGRGVVVEWADTWRFGMACALLGLVALAVAASVARGAGRLGFYSQRAALVGCAAVGAVVSGLWWALLMVAMASEVGPAAVVPGPRVVLSMAVGWVLLLSAAAALACGQPAQVATTILPDPRLPRVELPTDRPARWEVRFCTGFFTLGGCLLAMFGSTVFWSSPLIAAISWAAAALSLLMGRMTLRIDSRGITMAPWGLPSPVTISFDQVVEARPGTVHPLSWGGASHRVINARSGLWPRTGPGVTLVLADGRRLGLALDSAEVAAGIINTHLDRARGGPYTGPLRRLEDARADG